MNLNKRIEKLRGYILQCDTLSVYNYNEENINDLLCRFYTKILELTESTNSTLEIVEWLVNEGLSQEVAKKIDEMVQSGELADIITDGVLVDLGIMKKLNSNLVCPEMFGAKGGGVDDTIPLKKCFDVAFENGYTVVLNNIYHCHSKLEYLYNQNPLKTSFNIIGYGGSGMGLLNQQKSGIVFHNIGSKECGLSLIGENNGNVTSASIENILIELDYNSCHPLSFALKLGDSFGSYISRVKIVGANGVMLRCGTSQSNAISYANMCMKFSQLDVQCNRFIDWDGVTQLEKGKYGFAIANERIFFDNSATQYMSDNILFESCFFGGTVVNFGSAISYINCMSYISGGYKPKISNTTDFTEFYYKNLATNTIEKIDCSIGYHIIGGKATIQDGYFEDTPRCIKISKRGIQDVPNVTVKNPTIIATLNTNVQVNGVKQKCQYFLKSNIGGWNSVVDIEGGSFAQGNTGFAQGFVINDGSDTLIIKYVYGLEEKDIKDNHSKQKDINIVGVYGDKELKLNYVATDSTSGDVYSFLNNGERSLYEIRNSIIINNIIVSSKVDISSMVLLVYKNGGSFVNENIKLKIPLTGGHVVKTKQDDVNVYTINDIPRQDFEGSGWNRTFVCEKGELITVRFFGSSTGKIETTINMEG